MNQLYIVLAIMAFMIIAFFTGKIKFGLITMTCCLLLAVFGIYSIPKAFGGLCDKNIILVAGMFTMTTAFSKTSLLAKIQSKLSILKGKSNFVLVLGLYLIVIILSQFLPTTANMTIMMLFLMSLDNTGDVTPSRMLLPILAMIAVWGSKLPIGMGAAGYANTNAKYAGLGATPDQLLQMLDKFKIAIIPCIILTIYCIFFYKLMPNEEIDASKLKEVKKVEPISRSKEILIYIVFTTVMCSLFLNDLLGDFMYLIPIIGAFILTYTKAISLKEFVSSITNDSLWMLAGVLVMAQALGDTGAGDMIGNGILTILGGHPSGLFVMFVFAVVTIVMTTFMSNSATSNVLIPVAASTCIAAGWDPRGIVLVVSCLSGCAIAFPSGSPACGIAFAAGRYKISKTLKFTLPFIILAVISFVISANAFFPIYG